MKEKINTMKLILAKAELDAEKFENGNKAAGTRLRVAMQQLKAAAQDIRKTVSELKNA